MVGDRSYTCESGNQRGDRRGWNSRGDRSCESHVVGEKSVMGFRLTLLAIAPLAY